MVDTYILILGLVAILLFCFFPFYFLDLRGRSRRIAQQVEQLRSRKVHTYLLLENVVNPRYHSAYANNYNFVVKHRPFLAYILNENLHVDGSDKIRRLTATCPAKDTIIEASPYIGIGARKQPIAGIHIASTACDRRFTVLGQDVLPAEIYAALKARKIWRHRQRATVESIETYTKSRDALVKELAAAGFAVRS